MLGDTKLLKVKVFTTTLDTYEEKLTDFLENNMGDLVDIKICYVGQSFISVLIIYTPRIFNHPLK